MQLRCLNSISLPDGTEQTTTTCRPSHKTAALLTSTIPWLMVPYCLFLSITRLMTMTVAMATAMTKSPIRALLLRLKSSRSGPTASYDKDRCATSLSDHLHNVKDGRRVARLLQS